MQRIWLEEGFFSLWISTVYRANVFISFKQAVKGIIGFTFNFQGQHKIRGLQSGAILKITLCKIMFM